MASPVNDLFSNSTSGAQMRFGSAALPAWMATAGVALNKIVAIPGSPIAGTPAVTAGTAFYSSLVAKTDTNDVYAVCNGGHQNSQDNGVYKFPLGSDTPAWTMENAFTPAGQIVDGAAYYLDGKPGSRHTYDLNHYSATAGRIFMMGGLAAGQDANSIPKVDAFDPVTKLWDPQNTHTFVNYGLCSDPATGKIWTNALTSYNPVTKTYGPQVANKTIETRYPGAVDTTRNQIFTCQFGNGEGFLLDGTGNVNATRTLLGATTPTQERVTFTGSGAAQFLSENSAGGEGAVVGAYAGMCYDPCSDKFYWAALTGTSKSIYVITPNLTTVWDVTVFAPAAGSATLDPVSVNGLNGRLKAFPALKGIVICPSGDGTIFFIKTSN